MLVRFRKSYPPRGDEKRAVPPWAGLITDRRDCSDRLGLHRRTERGIRHAEPGKVCDGDFLPSAPDAPARIGVAMSAAVHQACPPEKSRPTAPGPVQNVFREGGSPGVVSLPPPTVGLLTRSFGGTRFRTWPDSVGLPLAIIVPRGRIARGHAVGARSAASLGPGDHVDGNLPKTIRLAGGQ